MSSSLSQLGFELDAKELKDLGETAAYIVALEVDRTCLQPIRQKNKKKARWARADVKVDIR